MSRVSITSQPIANPRQPMAGGTLYYDQNGNPCILTCNDGRYVRLHDGLYMSRDAVTVYPVNTIVSITQTP